MPKRILCLVLVTAVMGLTARVALAADAPAKEAALTEKVKAAIAKVGTGQSAKVEITLHDKTKLKGYIKEANEDNFVLVSDKTGASTEVAYPQVKKVKGHNLSTGAKVAIGACVALVVLMLVFKDHIVAY